MLRRNLSLIIHSFLIITLTLLISSCANQLPPSGGEDDKIPPKIITIIPKPNTTNFKDNKIIFKFDEYVDRRSFEESFYISPQPKGKMKFNWSGKEVEIEFSNSLDKNKTYVITIGKDLKDVRGGNKVETPITFAFSTGEKIDQGGISGKVYSDNYERVKILCYLKNGKTENKLNPEKNLPDFITQVSGDGSYKFTNLPEGSYRLFAIIDEDRNNLFDKDVDKIAVLSKDYTLSKDNNEIKDINFLLKDFEINKSGREFLKLLKPDSINFIYSNISNNEKNIPQDFKFYFYFKNNSLTKSDIVNNLSLIDSSSNKSYRLIFNWLNDSLLEIFSTEKFNSSSDLKFIIDLTKTKMNYRYSLNFKTADISSFGKVSGEIKSEREIKAPIFVKLFNKNNKFISYTKELLDTFSFRFENVLEGDYILFSFIDGNENSRFDGGKYYPFAPSEEFFIFEKDLKIKASWDVNNVFIKY